LLPAHAGMDPGAPRRRGRWSTAPRYRGDGDGAWHADRVPPNSPLRTPLARLGGHECPDTLRTPPAYRDGAHRAGGVRARLLHGRLRHRALPPHRRPRPRPDADGLLRRTPRLRPPYSHRRRVHHPQARRARRRLRRLRPGPARPRGRGRPPLVPARRLVRHPGEPQAGRRARGPGGGGRPRPGGPHRRGPRPAPVAARAGLRPPHLQAPLRLRAPGRPRPRLHQQRDQRDRLVRRRRPPGAVRGAGAARTDRPAAPALGVPGPAHVD
ncbi:hypothetical protein SAMN05421803_101562, partial [Nocardiopsis flavescens]